MRVTGRLAGFKAMRLNVITKEKRVERERAEQLLGHQHEEVTCNGTRKELPTGQKENQERAEPWKQEKRVNQE